MESSYHFARALFVDVTRNHAKVGRALQAKSMLVENLYLIEYELNL